VLSHERAVNSREESIMQGHHWLLCLTAAASAMSNPARLEAQPAQARIKLDPDRVIGEVHPHVFGNFAEHLGRCIYGGIFAEGSALSDEDGFRRDVMDATRGLGVSILRWPGGNFASGYDWKDGIGPRDERPVRRDHAWGAIETNRFGTDEFLRYCKRLEVEPFLCINAGLGSVDEARHWVEYTNESGNTYWADQRRKNGREEPWGVKYWGLGNEIDGPWQLGHKNADDYAKFALEAAKAMRRVDDSIRLIASGSSNFGPGVDWVSWNRTVLERLRNEIDYISLHTYIGNRADDFERFLAVSRDLDDRIEVVKGQIQAVRVGHPDARPIYIAFDEFNVWYRARSGTTEYEIASTGLEEIYNFEDALAMGVFMNSFFRHADVVKMANLAQLVNVIAPIFTNEQGLYLQTIYFPLAEYAKQRGNQSLDVLVESPQYRPDEGRSLGYLDVSATYDPKTGELFLNVLNRSEKTDITARIENVAGAPADQVSVWELNHPDFKASHTFGNDTLVRPTTRSVSVDTSASGFDYSFPKHSLTILHW
jgi:alpha-N-arabinofuranosidase